MKHEIEGILKKHSQALWTGGDNVIMIPQHRFPGIAEELQEYIEEKIQTALDDYRAAGDLHG